MITYTRYIVSGPWRISVMEATHIESDVQHNHAHITYTHTQSHRTYRPTRLDRTPARVYRRWVHSRRAPTGCTCLRYATHSNRRVWSWPLYAGLSMRTGLTLAILCVNNNQLVIYQRDIRAGRCQPVLALNRCMTYLYVGRIGSYVDRDIHIVDHRHAGAEGRTSRRWRPSAARHAQHEAAQRTA